MDSKNISREIRDLLRGYPTGYHDADGNPICIGSCLCCKLPTGRRSWKYVSIKVVVGGKPIEDVIDKTGEDGIKENHAIEYSDGFGIYSHITKNTLDAEKVRRAINDIAKEACGVKP